MNANDIYKSYLNSPYKSVKHSTYFDSYEHFFSKYRGKKITFVEIGVLGGGSLFMWRDYFGPQARIIGIDLNPNAKKWEKEGFEIYTGSQSDTEFWKKFTKHVGAIDIVLDDGGHTYEQQIITTECLLNSINDDGMLLVEDTHTSYMQGFGPKSKSFIEYTKQLIDGVNMRFGDFSKKHAERRLWSIEIVESMVAFHINRAASNLASEPTDNGGKDDHALDYRNKDNNTINYISSKLKKSNAVHWIRSFSFEKSLERYILNYLTHRKFSANRYFRY